MVNRFLKEYITIEEIADHRPPGKMDNDHICDWMESLKAGERQQPKSRAAGSSSSSAEDDKMLLFRSMQPNRPAPSTASFAPVEHDTLLSFEAASEEIKKSEKLRHSLLTLAKLALDQENIKFAALLHAESDPNVLAVLNAQLPQIDGFIKSYFPSDLATSIVSIRNARGRRGKELLYGDTTISDLQSNTTQMTACAALAKIKLLEVCDIKPQGSVSGPLAGFDKVSEPGAKMLSAFGSMQIVVSHLFPDMASEAALFFRQVGRDLEAQIARCRHPPWQVLSSWLAEIFKRITEPYVSLVVSRRGRGGYSFPPDLLTDRTTIAFRNLEDAMRNHLFEEARHAKPSDPRGDPRGDLTQPGGLVAGGSADGKSYNPAWKDKQPGLWFDQAKAAKGTEPRTGRVPCGFHFAFQKGDRPNDCRNSNCWWWHAP
jgi:hypothetical protein